MLDAIAAAPRLAAPLAETSSRLGGEVDKIGLGGTPTASQFELVAKRIEHVVDPGRGAWALVEDDGSIHDFAAMLREIGFRRFKISRP